MRKVLLATALIGLAWFSAPAQAEQAVIVQCRIDGVSLNIPDFACSAFEAGAEKLQPHVYKTAWDCMDVVRSRISASTSLVTSMCIDMWTNLNVGQAAVTSPYVVPHQWGSYGGGGVASGSNFPTHTPGGW